MYEFVGLRVYLLWFCIRGSVSFVGVVRCRRFYRISCIWYLRVGFFLVIGEVWRFVI